MVEKAHSEAVEVLVQPLDVSQTLPVIRSLRLQPLDHTHSFLAVLE